MGKTNWLKIVKKNEKKIVQEVVKSLKKAGGCWGEPLHNVLYIDFTGDMFWTTDTEGNLSEKVSKGSAIVLYSHKSDVLGCYACRDEECNEFDERPRYEDSEVDEQIDRKQILDEIYMDL